MNRINKESLLKLLTTSENETTRVTLLAPMQEAGPQVQQNHIQWKNVIKQAKDQLTDAGHSEEVIDKFLSAAESKIQDDHFWQHQSKALAYFSDDSQSQFFQFGHEVEPTVSVDRDFLISPLVRAANDSAAAYILACSPKRVRLLHIDGHDIEDLQPDCLPENLRDALNIDEYVSALQHHTTSSPHRTDGSAAVFHGHGGSDMDVRKQDELLQYFHRLNDGLEQFFDNEKEPLIFAGVEYLFPIFKEACSYRNLHSEVIAGNPDDATPEELLEKSKPILQQMRDECAKAELENYREKQHSDWASHNMDEIQKAADMGQVQSLLVDPNRNLADANHAIAATLRYGGDIVVIDEELLNELDLENMSEQHVAATFRTPAGSFLQSV